MPCSWGITLHIQQIQHFFLVSEMTNQENWNYHSSEGPVQHALEVAGPSEFWKVQWIWDKWGILNYVRFRVGRDLKIQRKKMASMYQLWCQTILWVLSELPFLSNTYEKFWNIDNDAGMILWVLSELHILCRSCQIVILRERERIQF